MLHPIMRKKIKEPAMALLYDHNINISAKAAPYTRSEFMAYIRNIRHMYKSTGVDRLKKKLNQFGNEGGWYRAQILELANKIYQSKGVPNEFLGKWRSIEFECVFKTSKAEKEFVLWARTNGYSKYMTIKNDGSISYEYGEIGREVVVSYARGNEVMVENICKQLKTKAFVNKTCGAHVHFDMRGVPVKTVITYAKRLGRCVPALKSILPTSRRNNVFCQSDVNTLGRGSRYAFVNLHSYSKYETLEVRGHSGTLDADKILNWIKICESIMTTKIRYAEKKVTSHKAIANLYKFDANLSKYMDERFNNFTDNRVEELT